MEQTFDQTGEQTSPPPTLQSLEQNLPPLALACLNRFRTKDRQLNLIVFGEDPADFYSLLAATFAEFPPTCEQDASLVFDSVLSRWLLTRRQRIYVDIETGLCASSPDPHKLSPENVSQLQMFDRYRLAAERCHKRAMGNIQHLRQNTERERKWRAQIELQTQRLNLERDRFNLAKEKDARTASLVAVEAQIKTRKAKEHLQFLQRHDNDPPFVDPLCIENGVCLIKQSAYISEKCGDARINKLTPSNEYVVELLKAHNAFLIPPQKVVRTFHFYEGRVPMEYKWVQLGVDKDFLARCKTPEPAITVSLTPERFEEIAEIEANLLRYQQRT